MFEVEKIKNANIATTIRFKEDLYSELKNISAETGVSFNSLVIQCCEYALKNSKGELKNNIT